MSEPVNGKYCILSMKVDTTFYPVLCGLDTTYSCDPEVIERTSATSGLSRQWARRIESHTSTVSGLTKVSNDSVLSFFYVLQTGIRRVRQYFQQTFADEDGNGYSITGWAIIGAQNINGPATDFSNASVTIHWDGQPDIDVIESPVDESCLEVQEPLYIDCVEGESSVSNALLTASGVDILCVERTGVGHDPVSGTPGNREFHFDTGTGVVSFDPTNVFNPGEVIYILYQK